jgi:hypothetical protein
MKTFSLMLLAAVFLIGGCLKSQAAETLPPALLVDGQPIDALCFSPVGGEPVETLSVKDCGKDLIAKERKDENALTHSVSYIYADDPEGDMGTSYVQYRYIGESAGASVVLVSWSGGGSGQFSTLLELTRDGDALKIVKILGGGDRCNGGIADAVINKKGEVEFKMSATPFDLVSVGGDPERAFMQTVKPFDDLDACAICCLGTVNYTNDAYAGVSISKDYLDSLYKDRTGESALSEKQACFAERMKSNTDGVQYEFAPDDWEAIVREVEHVCLGRVEGEE